MFDAKMNSLMEGKTLEVDIDSYKTKQEDSEVIIRSDPSESSEEE